MIQILYPIYNLDDGGKQRLELSIQSLRNQNQEIEICISDSSKQETKLNIGKHKYYHKYFGENNKSKTINYGVKKLINQDIFFLSDIDVIYPPEYLKYMLEQYDYYCNYNNTKETVLYYPMIRVYEPPILNYKKNYPTIQNDILKNKKFQLSLLSTMFEKQQFSPCILYNTNLFLKIKGYSEEYKGWGLEDYDIIYRLGFFTNYIDVPIYKNDAYAIHLYHDRDYMYESHDNNYSLFISLTKKINSKENALKFVKSIFNK